MCRSHHGRAAQDRQAKERGIYGLLSLVDFGDASRLLLTASNQAIKQFRSTSPADQIAVLEAQKDHLLQHKAAVQKKLDLFKERVQERENSGK